MTNKDRKIKKLQVMMARCTIIEQDSGDAHKMGCYTQQDDAFICYHLMLIQKRIDRILTPMLRETYADYFQKEEA